jgi:hypothetical protein
VPLAASDRVSPGHFILLILLLAALSTWVYWHASRHGSRHATAWGILTFIAPIVLVVYFVNYFATRRRF